MTNLLSRLSMFAALSTLAFGWTSPVLAGAQDPSDPHYSADPANHVEQAGKMFQVKLVPGEKRTELYLFGKKKGNAQLKNARVKADFTTSGNAPRPVEFKREDDRFIYEGKPLRTGDLHLYLQEDEKAPSEDIILKLK